jgi:hypothetical protein
MERAWRKHDSSTVPNQHLWKHRTSIIALVPSASGVQVLGQDSHHVVCNGHCLSLVPVPNRDKKQPRIQALRQAVIQAYRHAVLHAVLKTCSVPCGCI